MSEPGPTHQPYGQDPYGQAPYGQQPGGQPYPYGQQPSYGQRARGDRRPGTVTAAAWITIVFSALTALLFGITGLALLVARDQVITEIERVPEFQDANIDADAAVGVMGAVILGLVVWAIIAIVLAVLVLRRSNVARILLVISSAVVALLSLLGVTSGVSAVTLVAAAAVIVLLFVGGANDWFKGLSSGPSSYPGYLSQSGSSTGNPYGSDPYAPPTGQSSPHYPPPPSSSPYGQDDPYGQGRRDNPYGQAGDPYGQDNPYGQPRPTDGGSDDPSQDHPGR